jgi:hypothetical protein
MVSVRDAIWRPARQRDRAHRNSGHWTIDACITRPGSSYGQCLPLGSASITRCGDENLLDDVEKWREALNDPLVKLHPSWQNRIQRGQDEPSPG